MFPVQTNSTRFPRTCRASDRGLAPDFPSLSVVFRAAGRPAADRHLHEALLSEVIRLGERAVTTMQERWRFDTDGELRFRPACWSDANLEDLLWVQEELSADLLDLYDRYRPGFIESRASELCGRLERLHDIAVLWRRQRLTIASGGKGTAASALGPWRHW